MRALIFLVILFLIHLGRAATLVEDYSTEVYTAGDPSGFWILGETGLGAYHLNNSQLDDSGLQIQIGAGGAYYTENWMHQALIGAHRFENLDTNNWKYLARFKIDWTSGYRLDPKWQIGPSISFLTNTGFELLSSDEVSPFIGASVFRDFFDDQLLYKLGFKTLFGTNVDATAVLTFVTLQIGYSTKEDSKPVMKTDFSQSYVRKRAEPRLEVKEIAEGEYKVYLKTVNFDLGKSHLAKRDKRYIINLARSLSENGDKYTRISVKGHTDSVGTFKLNKNLSKKRAKRLKRYLLKGGVASDLVSTDGRADLEPKSAKLISRANRRAELIIHSPLSQSELRQAILRDM